jgi:hypothetical protein
VDPRAGLGAVTNNLLPLAGMDPRYSSGLACTLVTIPIEVFGLFPISEIGQIVNNFIVHFFPSIFSLRPASCIRYLPQYSVSAS